MSRRSVVPVDDEDDSTENATKTPEQLQALFLSTVGQEHPSQKILQDALCCCAVVDAADPQAVIKRLKVELCLDELCFSQHGA